MMRRSAIPLAYTVSARHAHCSSAFVQDEVDLAGVEIDTCDFHPQPIAETITLLRALAQQLMLDRIETEIIPAEIGNMHQSLHIHIVERDECAECGDAADAACERFAYLVLHVIALEPRRHVTGRFVRAALGHRAVGA